MGPFITSHHPEPPHMPSLRRQGLSAGPWSVDGALVAIQQMDMASANMDGITQFDQCKLGTARGVGKHTGEA